MAFESARKAQLIAEIDSARSRATAFRRRVETGGTPTSHLKEKVSQHRGWWLGGAALAGLALARLTGGGKRRPAIRARDRREAKQALTVQGAGRAGLFLGVLKLVIDLVKPVMMAYLTKRIGEAVAVGHQVKKKVERVDRKV